MQQICTHSGNVEMLYVSPMMHFSGVELCMMSTSNVHNSTPLKCIIGDTLDVNLTHSADVEMIKSTGSRLEVD